MMTLFGHLAPRERLALFLGVCIPLRLLLAWVVVPRTPPWLVVLALMTTLLWLETKRRGEVDPAVWWSRSSHELVVLTCLLLVALGQTDHLPKLLTLDILLGIGLALWTSPFFSMA